MARDPLKEAVAALVNDSLPGLLTADAVNAKLATATFTVEDVEAHDIDWLASMVRIKTNRGGVRYFQVKISEVM